MKSIFDFNDYREFLAFYYETEAELCGLTLAQFAKRAKLGSPNYLKLVIDGYRNLTSENIFKFSEALKLNHREEEYFECLVRYNQAKSESEKKFYKKRLRTQKSVSAGYKKLQPGMITDKWYIPACLVAAHGKTKTEAIKFCVKKFELSEEEIISCLEKLESLQSLKRDEFDRYTISSNFTSVFDPTGLNLNQFDYVREEIHRMLRAFNSQYTRRTGKFIAHTMTGPSDGAEYIKAELLDILAQIVQKFDNEPKAGDEVFSVNIQIVPTKKY